MAQAQLKDTSWHIKKKDIVFEPAQEKSLGAGSFGEVFTAKWLGNKVAAKRLHKRVFTADADVAAVKDSLKADERFHREYFLMMSLHHPHIVQLYGVHQPDESPNAPPVIIMELLSKTLRELINKGPRLLLFEVLDYSLQITSALCYLHGQVQPVIHRDLTTNNIMLTSNGICKIVDLGLAKVFDRAARKELTSRPGNACYMPGEVLAGIGRYDERLDVFSFNIVMLEMANGRVSQPSTDLLKELPGGAYVPIAETKRRETDLAYLADDHPLRPLIVSLLQPQKSLPSIAEVHERLQALQQSEEILRGCSGEVRAMRHHFEQQEEVHRQEIKDLKETVQSGHQVLQDVLQVTRDLHVTLRHTQERVEEVSSCQQSIQETLRHTQQSNEALHMNVTATQTRVEELGIKQVGIQQTVQDAFDSTERSVCLIREDLAATKCTVEEVAGTQNTLRDDVRKMKTGVKQEFSRCQTVMKKVLQTACPDQQDNPGSAKSTQEEDTAYDSVEEVHPKQDCECQQAVQDVLEQTERKVEGLRQDMAAMKEKVEEVAERQLQKCGRPCAAKGCHGKCVKPAYKNHGTLDCSCELSSCIEDCEICEPPMVKKCSSRHLHHVPNRQDKHHHCGRIHHCSKMCEEEGICALVPPDTQPEQDGSEQVGINGLRLQCAMTRPRGQHHHVPKQHSCGRPHTCEKQCPLCGYFCENPMGHDKQCWIKTHGPAKKLGSVDGIQVITGDGHEIWLDPTVTCDKICQTAGRGHSHIVHCTCHSDDRLTYMSGRIHMSDGSKRDQIDHMTFWLSLPQEFSYPTPHEESYHFGLCAEICPGCRSQASGTSIYCDYRLFHSRMSSYYGLKPVKGLFHGGHYFPCEEHKCKGTCTRLHTCGEPCIFLHDHSGKCSCNPGEYHHFS